MRVCCVPRHQPGPGVENKQYAGPELRPIARQQQRATERGEARAVAPLYHAGLTRDSRGGKRLARLLFKGATRACAAAGIGIDWMR